MSAVQWIVAHEAWLRMGVFLLLLAGLRLGERGFLLRPAGDGAAAHRQFTNIGLLLLDTAVLRLAFPVLAVALAVALQARGAGLFAWLGWPLWLEVLLAVLAFDLAIYWQHRLMHGVPLLWRMHRVHHSDTAFDVTTGVRFHPFEIALSMGIKLALVLLLGPHPLAVVLFEILLSSASLFTHGNFAFPARVDRSLRRLLVTPSMHRIHHSVVPAETHSNFGFSLTWWDRLFRSYRAAPMAPEREMPLGLAGFRGPREQHLPALLVQPFRSEVKQDA